jgi:hypothetical protein
MNEWSRNRRGQDGAYIRPFTNPVSFSIDPYCGCTIVWAPSMSKNLNEPFVLKFTYQICILGHK